MNTKEPTNAQKIRKLPFAILHTAFCTVFTTYTVFGAPFILFLDEIGLPKAKIGFLLSLFPFCGLLSLFIAPAVARAGFKRIFISFWGARKFVVAFLLLTPIVLSRYGLHITFIYVTCILIVFAIFRAIAETAYYPWFKEVVPNSVRGKFSAINNVVVTLVSCLAIAFAGYIIGHVAGLNKFMILIAIGVVFGLASVTCMFFIPGGAPILSNGGGTTHFRKMKNTLQDKNFLAFLGVTGVILASVSLLSFMPLFMKEQVGLTDSKIVLLQIGTLLGGLVSGFLWGWAADRYGSKPVALSGLHMLALVPVFWIIIPRHSVWSNPAAMSIAFIYGLVGIGWSIGANRLLYVGVVPSEKKTEYMAIYYAWMGLIGGFGRLLAGRILGCCQGVTGRFFIFTLDPYTPLLAGSIFLMIAGILFLRKVRADGAVPAGKFVKMFLQGNPFLAIQSLIKYNLAKEEKSRVSVTERLGQSKSPLNVDELLKALSDPSFNVRYEAIISIARTRPDDRLINALINLLGGKKSDLSTAAAWALGRIGEVRAIEPLRKALKSAYPLLQARSARALATLSDYGAIPLLLDSFRNEKDDGMKMAYASALGTLRADSATGELLNLMRRIEDDDSRMELALALARILGNEHYFIHLWNQSLQESGTAAAQAILSLKKKMKRLHLYGGRFLKLVDDCADAMAGDDFERGAKLLSDIIGNLPVERFGKSSEIVLNDCRKCLSEFGASRIEYVLLSMHTIDTGLNFLKK